MEGGGEGRVNEEWSGFQKLITGRLTPREPEDNEGEEVWVRIPVLKKVETEDEYSEDTPGSRSSSVSEVGTTGDTWVNQEPRVEDKKEKVGDIR